MEFRNKVGTCDIDERSCGERNQCGNHTLDGMSYHKCDNHTEHSSQRRQKINKQRFFLAETAMDKYTKISHLLRDFVKNNFQSRGDTEWNTNKITRSDNQSIYQIMNHISDQIHDRKRMRMLLSDRHMAMISANDFFRNQTKKYTSKQSKRYCKGKSIRFYRFRQ